jgi:hypothetical protein
MEFSPLFKATLGILTRTGSVRARGERSSYFHAIMRTENEIWKRCQRLLWGFSCQHRLYHHRHFTSVDRTDTTHNALQINDINCTNSNLMFDQTSPSRCNKPIKTCLLGNFIATKQMGTKTLAEGVQVYSEVTRASPAEKIDKTANLACNLELIGAAVAAQDPTQDKLSLSGLTEGMAMLLQTAIRLMTFMRIVRVLHHLYHSRTLLQVQTRLRRRSTTLKSMILGLFTHMLQLEKGTKAMLRSRNYLRSLSDLIFPMFLHLSLPILCTIAASLILAVCHTCSALMILRLLGTDLAEASLIKGTRPLQFCASTLLEQKNSPPTMD